MMSLPALPFNASPLGMTMLCNPIDNDVVKSSLTAEGTNGVFSDKEYTKSRMVAGLKPLPFDGDLPTDEFANYIDNMIQIL